MVDFAIRKICRELVTVKLTKNPLKLRSTHEFSPIFTHSIGRRPQIGLPHVRADKFYAFTTLLADHIEELLEALNRAIFPDPQQPNTALLNLIDQGEIFVTLRILDLIDTNPADLPQIAVRKSPFYDILYRVEYFILRRPERNRGFLPAKLPRPVGQKQHIGLGQLVFANCPWDFFDPHPTSSAIDAPHVVKELHHEAPEGDEIEAAKAEAIVTRGALMAARAHRL